MRNKKTRCAFYPAWEYRREVEDLNALSDQGWQLEKGGCFRSRFYRDESVRYRYALDYNTQIDDPVRYREIFAEQGWEFVSDTFNGWHYFRKVYDPSLPPEEYEIYTDEASVRDMSGRWSRLGYAFGVIELVCAAMNLFVLLRHPSITNIAMALVCLWLGVMILVGARRIRRPETAGRPKKSMGWCFAVVFALLAVGLVFGIVHSAATVDREYVYDPDSGPWTWQIHVSLPDFYTLDVEADTDAYVDITVTNHRNGKEMAALGGGWDLRAKGVMFLLPGTYDVTTKYAEGTEPGTTGMFRYEMD